MGETHPVIGLEEDMRTLMGFVIYGPFRTWPDYKFSVEHSVCFDARFLGRGVGKKLMTLLVGAAKSQNYHMMVGVIDATNVASLALRQNLGFVPCGMNHCNAPRKPPTRDSTVFVVPSVRIVPRKL
jgi:L-amino acid N-acyltransferase YncA